MSAKQVTQDQILQELHGLEPGRWPEVLDFIGYLKANVARAQSPHRELTARDLLQSGLVGLWANRQDIGDSLSFARRIREQAEHHRRGVDDPA